MTAVHGGGLLLREERLEDEDLAKPDPEDGEGDEDAPDHDALIQLLRPVSALDPAVNSLQ